MMNFLLSSFSPGDSPCMSCLMEAGNLLLPMKFSAGPLPVCCCDGSLGFLFLFCLPEKNQTKQNSSSLDNSDSASPVLKSIKYQNGPQYLSIFELRWRHPKFWALPATPGGIAEMQTIIAIYWDWGEQLFPAESPENYAVKPWGHWGPWESHTHDKSVTSLIPYPDQAFWGLLTSHQDCLHVF